METLKKLAFKYLKAFKLQVPNETFPVILLNA